MTKREIANRKKAAKDRLRLIQLYKQEFYDKIGKKGVEELVNQNLEEILYLNELSKKIKDNEKDK